MNLISTRDRAFIDEKGRERIFNGVNYVFKGEKPEADGIVHFIHPLDDAALRDLRAKGVNIIRLGMTWAGIEPKMGEYNEVYLNEVRDVVDRAKKYGIYVYLDWHQDLYSGFGLGVGDGAPAWACLTKKKMRKPLFIWAEGYFFGGAVWECFDAFWRNAPLAGRGIRDRFCDMLRYTVSYLSGCENIMGFDVLNEPFPGSLAGKLIFPLVARAGYNLSLNPKVDRRKLFRDLTSGEVMNALSVIDDPEVYHALIDPAEKVLKTFDAGVYYDFIRAAGEAIRSVCGKGVLFFENSYFSNLGIPCNVPHVVYEDGRREENLVFAPHGYDLTVDTPLTNEASTARVDFIFDEHKRKQNRMGLPVLVGEWGGMVAGGERYPALEHLIAKFDGNKWSHTYWHYSREILDSKIFDILSRPYPEAVSGRIECYGYDREKKEFTLCYEGAPEIKVPTVIYLPEAPKSVEATKKYTVKPMDGYYLLQVNAGKGEIRVKVTL